MRKMPRGYLFTCSHSKSIKVGLLSRWSQTSQPVRLLTTHHLTGRRQANNARASDDSPRPSLVMKRFVSKPGSSQQGAFKPDSPSQVGCTYILAKRAGIGSSFNSIRRYRNKQCDHLTKPTAVRPRSSGYPFIRGAITAHPSGGLMPPLSQ